MKAKNYNFILSLDLLFVILTIGFEYFFTQTDSLILFVLREISLLGLVLGAVFLLIALAGERRWSYRHMYMFFAYFLLNMFFLGILLGEGLGWTGGTIGLGTVLVLILALMLNSTQDERLSRMVVDKKSKKEISKLRSTYDRLSKEDEELRIAIEDMKNKVDSMGENVPYFVSSKDGKKFHKPKCRIVENIPKGSVVTHKSSEEALANGLTPCGVCHPVTKEVNFVANKDAEKFHKTTCMHVKNIPRSKKMTFKDDSDALAAGFKPCGLCKPLD